MSKAVQALAIWLSALLLLGFIWAPALRLPQLWMLVLISVMTNILQPSYRPFEGSRTKEDRGTATQILWTVYLTQVAALVELVIRRRANLPLDALTWAALTLMLAGLVLRTWAVLVLGAWFTWNVTVQPGQALVSRGPYRFIRHPSYTGAFAVFVSSCMLLRSWISMAAAAAALLLAFLRRIRYEEALLTAALPGYSEYALRTGMLLPRVAIWLSQRGR